jgi:hypothetical protein
MTEDGSTRLDLRIEGETVWMSQSQMADLFQRSKKTIRHTRTQIMSGLSAGTIGRA